MGNGEVNRDISAVYRIKKNKLLLSSGLPDHVIEVDCDHTPVYMWQRPIWKAKNKVGNRKYDRTVKGCSVHIFLYRSAKTIYYLT